MTPRDPALERRRGARITGTRRGVPLRAALPDWIEPMLATLVDPVPLADGWIYEPKLDGVRVQARVADGRVTLRSRNRNRLDDAYPELCRALAQAARGDAILDGEVVATDPETGEASFARLQRRMQLRDPVRAARSGVAVELWLFDCMHWEGIDLRGRPLEERKLVLRDAVRWRGAVRWTPAIEGGFDRLYGDACARGAEGLVGKRLAAPYARGRSRDWVKLKCVRSQELVIGGWTEPRGSREGLGALLVGYYEGGKLRYAGKVGTGFDARTLADLTRALERIERADSPFDGDPAPPRDARWAQPRLVAQVGFGEWTEDRLLRHPRFLGLRDDKAPREVRREV